MVSLKSDSVNLNITQTLYDKLTDVIQLAMIRCPRCNQVGFTIHGYYRRRVKRDYLANHETDNFLTVMRVACSECGRTHAILPDFQKYIDEFWLNQNIMFIVCGYSLSIMEEKVLSKKSPLFGRRTGRSDWNLLIILRLENLRLDILRKRKQSVME